MLKILRARRHSRGCTVNAHDNLPQILRAAKFLQDVAQCGCSEFADMAGQDQGDRRILCKFTKLGLEPRQIGGTKPVERRNGSSLEEIGHGVGLGMGPPNGDKARRWGMAARPSPITSASTR